MTRKTFGVLLLSALAVVPGTAVRAQTSVRIKANIPFEFNVGLKTMPAGIHAIAEQGNTSRVLSIQGLDHGAGQVFTPVTPASTARVEDAPSLSFSRYGGQYLLSQVRLGGGKIDGQLPASRSERELMRSGVVCGEVTVLLAAKKN
ncbi:MAG: hypothetical protein HY822_15470 [Acidobacteria bacterium]|nr:hypothetical protein [Acidobacteriota bacterium]